MRPGLFARFSRATKYTAGRITNDGRFARRCPVFSKRNREFAGNDDGSDSRVSTRVYFNQEYIFTVVCDVYDDAPSCIPAYDRA